MRNNKQILLEPFMFGTFYVWNFFVWNLLCLEPLIFRAFYVWNLWYLEPFIFGTFYIWDFLYLEPLVFDLLFGNLHLKPFMLGTVLYLELVCVWNCFIFRTFLYMEPYFSNISKSVFAAFKWSLGKIYRIIH